MTINFDFDQKMCGVSRDDATWQFLQTCDCPPVISCDLSRPFSGAVEWVKKSGLYGNELCTNLRSTSALAGLVRSEVPLSNEREPHILGDGLQGQGSKKLFCCRYNQHTRFVPPLREASPNKFGP